MDKIEVILTILSIISALFGIFGVSAYISERAKHRAQRRNINEDEREEEEMRREQQELVDTIKLVIKEEITPVNTSLKTIQSELSLDKAATITSLRSNMKQLRDKYKAQGYADAGDTATWNELYNNYKAMGGNHFVEYVDQWKEEVNNLPLEKPKKNKGE